MWLEAYQLLKQPMELQNRLLNVCGRACALPSHTYGSTGVLKIRAHQKPIAYAGVTKVIRQVPQTDSLAFTPEQLPLRLRRNANWVLFRKGIVYCWPHVQQTTILPPKSIRTWRGPPRKEVAENSRQMRRCLHSVSIPIAVRQVARLRRRHHQVQVPQAARLCGLPACLSILLLASPHHLPAAERRASVARRASVWTSTIKRVRPGKGERTSLTTNEQPNTALMPNALMPTRFSPLTSLQRCLSTNAESRVPNAAPTSHHHHHRADSMQLTPL